MNSPDQRPGNDSDDPYRPGQAANANEAPEAVAEGLELLERSRNRWMNACYISNALVFGLAFASAKLPSIPGAAILSTLIPLLMVGLLVAAQVCAVMTGIQWMRLKGREPMPIALLSIPFGLISFVVFAAMRDKSNSVEARVRRGETEQIFECPHCGFPYDPAEYRSDLTEILCTRCRNRMPRIP